MSYVSVLYRPPLPINPLLVFTFLFTYSFSSQLLLFSGYSTNSSCSYWCLFYWKSSSGDNLLLPTLLLPYQFFIELGIIVYEFHSSYLHKNAARLHVYHFLCRSSFLKQIPFINFFFLALFTALGDTFKVNQIFSRYLTQFIPNFIWHWPQKQLRWFILLLKTLILERIL